MKINTKVTNINRLVNIINSMNKSNQELLDFLKPKFLETLEETIKENFVETDNENSYYSIYKQNNKFIDINNGFILYNSTVIPASELNITDKEKLEKYPNGFSITLAFEFGVGIRGQNTSQSDYYTSWEYNVNNYEKGWVYFKNGDFHFTSGYEGMAIYSKTVSKIKQRLNGWIKDYYVKENKL